ncbi:Oligopeptide transport system substrate-binding protein OS=Bosea thiooxidans OX=53254 GN=SAMN05660750_02185 PE=3 SV=1 [Bosea thiooxidans]|uniref:Oligopeptide transport system substrate-binding protein n=1 Tax=Bosea thiooxidans TaxID=53254 RepID=A0A1T5DXX9_9HYPH|nr:ABC transporter substrate-binding protein [Bosea thiooxidans]SKB76410.1 oligopeptide transport system substrate-binding protein [Bosea thiooxidans]
MKQNRFSLGVAALPFAVACGALVASIAPGQAQAPQPGWVTVSACTPAGPLIPTNTTESCGSDVLQPILAGLVTTDAKTGAIIEDVAESITTSDNKTWTIKLRKGRKFHDGTEVLAKNFVDAWNWAAYGPNGQSNNDWFSVIVGYGDLNPKAPKGEKPPAPATNRMTGLKVVNDHEFQVELSNPVPVFRAQLSYKAFYPMPDSFFADPAAFGRKPIGAGPFQFVSGAPDSGYKLAAFADYAGPAKPSIKGIDLRIYTSREAAYNDLVAGNLDLLRDIPASKLVGDLWKRDLRGRAVTQPRANIQALGMPYTDANPQLLKPAIRQALSMAIDRKAIVDILFNGIGQPATGWVPPGTEGYQPGACGEYCSFNPEKAKALLAQAGGYKGEIKLYYAGDSEVKSAMDAVCNSIQNTLSITCVTSALSDNATFRSYTRSGKVDGLFPSNWTMDYPSIDNALIPLYSKAGTSNRGAYESAAFDALLDKAAKEETSAAIKTYQEAERLLTAEMPRVPLWNPAMTVGHSPKVRSVTLYANGRIDYSALSLKD